MAKIEFLAPKILKWEGGYVDDPADPGGATNKGVTLSTWRQVGYDKDGDGDIDEDDIRLLNHDDFIKVLKHTYWDRWQADLITNQSIAELLVDWVWGSGKWGIIIPQRLLGVKQDGIVGPLTIGTLNSRLPSGMYQTIFDARIRFIRDIVQKSIHDYEEKRGEKSTPAEQMKMTLKRFEAGWMNRLYDFKFEA